MMIRPRTKIYCCHAMSGRKGIELCLEATRTLFAAKRVSDELIILDPITEEKVKADMDIVSGTMRQLKRFWARDKEMIREAHVVFDLSGAAKSEGCAHEIGYARFFLYKPVVRLYPGLSASVARLEDDVIVDTMEDGFRAIHERWGTPVKRLLWRVRMLKKLPKALWYKLREWLNIF